MSKLTRWAVGSVTALLAAAALVLASGVAGAPAALAETSTSSTSTTSTAPTSSTSTSTSTSSSSTSSTTSTSSSTSSSTKCTPTPGALVLICAENARGWYIDANGTPHYLPKGPHALGGVAGDYPHQWFKGDRLDPK